MNAISNLTNHSNHLTLNHQTPQSLPGRGLLTRQGFSLLLLSGMVSGFSPTAPAADNDVLVAHAAHGQLKARVEFPLPLDLESSTFPGFPGFATGEVGFHSAAEDEPADDLFQLSPLADTRFILLAKDPGMEVWNDHGSAPMAIGESFFMGPPFFDTHPLFNLQIGIPGQSYSLTLRIHDVMGIYTDSEPFELTFTPALPVVSLAVAGPGLVSLSWTPDTAGFVLQSSPALNPANWTNAPSGPTNPVVIPASGLQGYYRVAK